MSGEEDERKRTHNSEKGEWEREMKSLKSQLEAKDNLSEELRVELGAKDNLSEEQRVEIRAKDSQLKKKDLEIELVLRNTGRIVKLSCKGSSSSNMNPSNHKAAKVELKNFGMW